MKRKNKIKIEIVMMMVLMVFGSLLMFIENGRAQSQIPTNDRDYKFTEYQATGKKAPEVQGNSIEKRITAGAEFDGMYRFDGTAVNYTSKHNAIQGISFIDDIETSAESFQVSILDDFEREGILKLNQTSDVITYPLNIIHNFPREEYILTFETWFLKTSNEKTSLAFGNGENTFVNIQIEDLDLGYNSSSSYTKIDDISAETWYHLRVEILTNEVNVFLDGIKTGIDFYSKNSEITELVISTYREVVIDAVGYQFGYLDEHEATETFDSYTMTEGQYYGSYDFRDGTDGGFADYMDEHADFNYEEEYQGHKDVFWFQGDAIGNVFDESKTAGTIEFWLYPDRDTVYFSLLDGGSSEFTIRAQWKVLSEHWEWEENGNLVFTSDEGWMHNKIEWNASANEFMWVANGTDHGTFSYTFSRITGVEFHSGLADYRNYLDAVGFDFQDTGAKEYEIGWNTNPYDIQPLIESDSFSDLTLYYGSEVSILNGYEGHSTVLSLQDYTVAGQDPIMVYNINQTTSGISEWYFRTNDASEYWIWQPREDTDPLGRLRVFNSELQWYDGSTNVFICDINSDQWYHFKFVWYADNTVDVYIDNVLELEGSSMQNNQVSGLDNWRIIAAGDSEDYLYLDAWDFNESVGYYEGRNLEGGLRYYQDGYYVAGNIYGIGVETDEYQINDDEFYVDDIYDKLDGIYSDERVNGWHIVNSVNITDDPNQDNDNILIFNNSESFIYKEISKPTDLKPLELESKFSVDNSKINFGIGTGDDTITNIKVNNSALSTQIYNGDTLLKSIGYSASYKIYVKCLENTVYLRLFDSSLSQVFSTSFAYENLDVKGVITVKISSVLDKPVLDSVNIRYDGYAENYEKRFMSYRLSHSSLDLSEIEDIYIEGKGNFKIYLASNYHSYSHPSSAFEIYEVTPYRIFSLDNELRFSLSQLTNELSNPHLIVEIRNNLPFKRIIDYELVGNIVLEEQNTNEVVSIEVENEIDDSQLAFYVDINSKIEQGLSVSDDMLRIKINPKWFDRTTYSTSLKTSPVLGPVKFNDIFLPEPDPTEPDKRDRGDDSFFKDIYYEDEDPLKWKDRGGSVITPSKIPGGQVIRLILDIDNLNSTNYIMKTTGMEGMASHGNASMEMRLSIVYTDGSVQSTDFGGAMSVKELALVEGLEVERLEIEMSTVESYNTLTNKIGKIRFIYHHNLEDSMFILEMIEFLIPFIMILVPTFLIYLKLGRKAIIPTLFLMVLILTIVSMIPIWVFFVITVAILFYIITEKRRGL